MPRLLSLGHVTWDVRLGQEVLGGSVSYSAIAARKLGWQAGVLTSAGPDFSPERDLPGVDVFLRRSPATTRFQNEYDEEGVRRQVVEARSDDVDFEPLPEDWRSPDALLLCPVAGELGRGIATGFRAGVVGAIAQGWLRAVDPSGSVSPKEWRDPGETLAGVHALFLSELDLPDSQQKVPELLEYVPIVALTRGWRGLSLYTREGIRDVPSLPRPEVDPTGAGDVFAAAFLVRYHESGDIEDAGAFGACAASCAVEGVGVTGIGDRREVERRLALRERLIEDGEWDE